MAYVESYKDLEVYKLSRKLSFELFELSKNFPKEERYSLTDQIRRSSRSVGAQIAEAWGKRRYEKHFVSKLTDSTLKGLKRCIGSIAQLIAAMFQLTMQQFTFPLHHSRKNVEFHDE